MITTDARQVLSMFAELSPKKQIQVYKKALKESSNVLVKETRKELRKHVKGTSRVHTDSKGRKYSMNRGIKSLIWKKGNGATVVILGDFRLKFFETGTAERRTKKGYRRGRIKAKHFFRIAKGKVEKQIFDNIDKYIENNIKRIASKGR